MSKMESSRMLNILSGILPKIGDPASEKPKAIVSFLSDDEDDNIDQDSAPKALSKLQKKVETKQVLNYKKIVSEPEVVLSEQNNQQALNPKQSAKNKMQSQLIKTEIKGQVDEVFTNSAVKKENKKLNSKVNPLEAIDQSKKRFLEKSIKNNQEKQEIKAVLSSEDNSKGNDSLEPETLPSEPTPNASQAESKKTKNKKKDNKREPKEYSSNWLSFLKQQKTEGDKTVVHTIVKKSKETVKLTPIRPIEGSYAGLTPFVALDCEMVQVEGNEQALARCSIVNYNGHALLDKLIKPKKKVTNYLTRVSGMTHAKLRNAETFDACKEEIMNILKGRIIVGHTLKSDFEVLSFYPEEKNLRDLTHLKSLKDEGKTVGLKKMVEKYLKYRIQTGEHDSVEDARAAMALYRHFEKEWENKLRDEAREKNKKPIKKPKSKQKASTTTIKASNTELKEANPKDESNEPDEPEGLEEEVDI